MRAGGRELGSIGVETLGAPDLKEHVMPKVLLDAAGRRRSPATVPSFHAGRPPRNKGRRYPADPPTVAEIVAVIRQAGDGHHGHHGRRLRGLIVVLWCAGLRIHEALALSEADLDRAARLGARAPRQGRAPPPSRDGRLGLGATRAVAEAPRRAARRAAVLHRQRTDLRARVVGQRCSRATSGNRRDGRRPPPLHPAPAATRARGRDGPRRRPLLVIQRQLGHTNLGITSIYLQGIDSAEIIDTVHARRAPMVPVDGSLRT